MARGPIADGATEITVRPTRLTEVRGYVDQRSGAIVRDRSVPKRAHGAGRGQTASRRAMRESAMARDLMDAMPDVACASIGQPLTPSAGRELARISAHTYLAAMSDPVMAGAIGSLLRDDSGAHERASATATIENHPLAMRLASLDATISARRYALHLGDTLRAQASETVKAALVRDHTPVVGFERHAIDASRSVGAPALTRQGPSLMCPDFSVYSTQARALESVRLAT